MSLDIIKCPHCGYMYHMDLAKYKQERMATITKSLFGKSEPEREIPKYVDLKCPNSACGKWFEWKVE